MKKCLKKALKAIGIIKAVISRILFASHGFVCIWRVVVVKKNPLYWCLTGSLPFLILEAIFTLRKKKGGEWKWVCPSVLLYLCTTVPAIWFLELNLLDRRIMAARSGGRIHGHKIPNASKQERFTFGNSQISLPVFFNADDWCKILEQMMLLVLIVGRWLLPKGEITREQLSQLLLVYIGMAADIIELFEAFKEKEVRYNKILTMIILSMWTASLMQFTFVLTATKSKRMRPVLFHSGSSASTISVRGKSCCPTEVISILISVMLQDGPFLVMRMMLIFRYGVLSYTNLFFTSKNTLVLVLQFYRLLVLFCQKKEDSPFVIPKDAMSSPGTSETKSLRITETPKLIKKLSSDMSFDEYSIAERRKSFMRQDSIVESSNNLDVDVIDEDMEEKYINDKIGEDETDDISDDFPVEDKSKKREKKKKRKKKEEKTKMAKQGREKVCSEDKGHCGEGKKQTNGDRGHWGEVRKMAKALAFLNEAGKCRTVVVNSGGQEHTLVIVDEEHARKLDIITGK